MVYVTPSTFGKKGIHHAEETTMTKCSCSTDSTCVSCGRCSVAAAGVAVWEGNGGQKKKKEEEAMGGGSGGA